MKENKANSWFGLHRKDFTSTTIHLSWVLSPGISAGSNLESIISLFQRLSQCTISSMIALFIRAYTSQDLQLSCAAILDFCESLPTRVAMFCLYLCVHTNIIYWLEAQGTKARTAVECIFHGEFGTTRHRHLMGRCHTDQNNSKQYAMSETITRFLPRMKFCVYFLFHITPVL